MKFNSIGSLVSRVARRRLAVGASLVSLATLTACVAPGPVYQTRYPYHPAQSAYGPPPSQGQYVEFGQVANIEVFRTEGGGGGTSGAGAVTGGLIGGVVGNQFGRGNGRAAATAIGLVGGALLGNSVESNANAPRVHETFRVSIRTENGAYRAFDVPNPGDLRVGDRVRIDNGQISRI